MSETHDRLVEILTPAMRDVQTASDFSMMRATREALTEGGEIIPKALRTALPWTDRTFWVPGTVGTGGNVAQQLRVRQPSRLVYLDASVKRAPSGGPLIARVKVLGGEVLESVSIASGRLEGFNTANTSIPAGALIVLHVAEANAALDLTVTAWLVPDTR